MGDGGRTKKIPIRIEGGWEGGREAGDTPCNGPWATHLFQFSCQLGSLLPILVLPVGGRNTHTSHGEYQTDIHARQGTDQVEDIVANSIATGGRGQCMHSQAVSR